MNRAPTLRSPCGERVTNLGQHAVLPLPKASLPRYSILDTQYSQSFWPTDQRVN